jgi:hypothetical protein
MGPREDYEPIGFAMANGESITHIEDYFPSVTCFEKQLKRCNKCSEPNIDLCKSRQGCTIYQAVPIIRIGQPFNEIPLTEEQEMINWKVHGI